MLSTHVKFSSIYRKITRFQYYSVLNCQVSGNLMYPLCQCQRMVAFVEIAITE